MLCRCFNTHCCPSAVFDVLRCVFMVFGMISMCLLCCVAVDEVVFMLYVCVCVVFDCFQLSNCFVMMFDCF